MTNTASLIRLADLDPKIAPATIDQHVYGYTGSKEQIHAAATTNDVGSILPSKKPDTRNSLQTGTACLAVMEWLSLVSPTTDHTQNLPYCIIRGRKRGTKEVLEAKGLYQNKSRKANMHCDDCTLASTSNS